MPNGTLLEVLDRRYDRWWHVRVFPTGQEGWALSGVGNWMWIECCVTGSGSPIADKTQPAQIGFKTPSHNIFCQFVEGTSGDYATFIRCDIKYSYAAQPPRPSDCNLDWGYAYQIAVDAPKGESVCHGDTAIDEALLTLAYGSVWQRNGIRCKSESVGLTCINALGHGFSLSREQQRLF